VSFYSALGIEFRSEKHGDGPHHHSAEVNGTVIEVYPSASTATIERGSTADVRLGFEVDDLSATLAALIAHGGSIVSDAKPRDGRQVAVVADPEGRRVEIVG
jgi:predicted enzyme related to lactoylglutathione lyase